ncbi:MAG: hypothetical protein ACYS9T_03510 [Planctomycetota bacterium]
MWCKQNFLSILRKIGPLAAGILMLTPLLLFICMMDSTHASLANLVSGKVFLCGFQYPSRPIQRWYAVVTFFIAIALPYTVLARCFSHRKTRLAYWSFVIPTAALYLYLLIILTIPFSWLIQYIDAMGFTAKRIYGVFYGLGGYVVVLGFLWWAVRKPEEKEPQTKIDKIEEQKFALLNYTPKGLSGLVEVFVLV